MRKAIQLVVQAPTIASTMQNWETLSDLDQHGVQHVHELEGFPATVVQHEFDHLDGRLYIDHITDTERLAFDEEFNRYIAPQLS